MIFKEAVKSKVRLSITGYEDAPQSVIDSAERRNSDRQPTASYGWNLEPPPNPNL